MKKSRAVRGGALLSLVFTLSVLLAPGTAFAETITPAPPVPGLNVLPSTLKGAVVGGTANQQMLAAMIYKFSQTPSFWKAASAMQSGTATPGQITTVSTVKAGHAVPATKPSKLVKGLGVAGGALTVVSGLDFGISIGAGVNQILGVDATGTVCSTTSGLGQQLASYLSGVSCDDFNTFEAEYVPNFDAQAGQIFDTICAPSSTWCATFIKYVPREYNSGAPSTQRGWCWQRSDLGSSIQPPNGIELRVLTNEGWSPTKHLLGTGAIQAQCGTSNATGWFSNGITLLGYRLVDAATGAVAAEATYSDIPADPARQLKCVLLSTAGNTYSALTAVYRETDGIMPAPECPELPNGEDLSSAQIWQITEGAPDELLLDEGVTPEYQYQQQQFPECAGATCRLELVKDGTLQCLDNPLSCTEWFTDPDKSTTYTCRYGGQVVNLSECTVYAPSFTEQARLTGQQYGDPDTGAPLAKPSGSTTGSDALGFGAPVQNPAQKRECYPTGWGVLNPVEWVMKPVQCALEWAFVPRASKIDNATQRLQSSWSSTTPAKVVASIATVIPALENLSDGGCGGLTVDLSGIAPNILDDPSGTLLAACPGDFFHPWAPWIKAFLVISISVSGFFAIKAQISRFVSNGEA